MSATALSRLNPVVSQFGFQVAAKSSNKSFFSLSGAQRRFLSGSGRRGPPRAMATSGSLPVFGDACLDDLFTACANGLDFTKKPSSTGGGGVAFFAADCSVGSVRLGRKRDQMMKSRLVCHYSSIDPLDKKTRSLFGAFSKSVHTSSSVCFSAHELSTSSQDSDLSPTTTTSLKSLKLVSGSCCLPHPEKEATGGEDAHFICDEEQVIGVADGVGGWAEVGVNAGLYSRELMSYSVSAIRELAKGSSSVDPLMVLEKAHSQTSAQGSSTACIIALTDKGLHAINLGDSGFTVVRDGSTVFQSPVQQHGFNFTYQLGSGNSGGDLPQSGQVFMIDVEAGDVIVAGTDGVYDNLYNEDITGVVVSSVRAGLDPKATAQKIADLARARALDKKRQSPFAAAAQEAGYRYYGGKLDDITAVVSFVTPA